MDRHEVVNPKTGERIVCTLSMSDAMASLNRKNREKPSTFSSGLIASHRKYNRLSDSQWFWVYKLVQEVDEIDSVELTVDFTKDMIASFMKSELKYPALHFNLCKIYIHEGELRVKNDNGRCGYIKDDMFYPTSKASDKLIKFIVELSKAPFECIAKEGKQKGICCFCKRKLTNEESVFRGYGPICASRYDLPYDHSKQNPLPIEREWKGVF